MVEHTQHLLYVVRRTATEFQRHRCIDLAAALTYYSVVAIFPALVALVALLGLVGQAEESITTMLSVLRPVVSAEVLGVVEPLVRRLADSRVTGFALVVGPVAALWSASAYVNAFSWAMNQLYGVEEGRSFLRRRWQMLQVTLVCLVLTALAAVLLVLSGELARSVGRELGLSETTLATWSLVKWPALAVVVLLLVTLLYWGTPNVRLPRIRPFSPGALISLVTGLLASAGFNFYVSHFASYDRTYGSLGGIIVTLLLLWLCNLALLVGAQLDVEITRMRQLTQGLPAETTLQLPVRDDRSIARSQVREWALVREGREIRLGNARAPRDRGQEPADAGDEQD